MLKIYIWQNTRTKQWHCTIVAHNGNILFYTEGYHHKSAAVRAVEILSDYFYMFSWRDVFSLIKYSRPKPSPRRKRKAKKAK
jgi:uncharacterized protein YegP (UPF0339 family)